MPQFTYPAELPIVSYREDFLDLLQNNQVIVVSGETGSGKTTQLPKFCLESSPDSDLVIGCTQPRRVAATSVSSRVASELCGRGDLVGYKIRFHDRTSKETRIKFMTDGVLLAETRQDPLLAKYGVIIIDEAHERSLNIDFLLGYLKNLLPRRPDLKVIITSATIDTRIFAGHFADAPILTVEGRSYPVEVRYREEESTEGDDGSYVEQCVESVLELHRYEPPEDTLIFLPTEKDIRECCSLLEKRCGDCLILPMFGRLQAGDQKKIFQPSSRTKIVVATNVAETSITVPGIRYVIDSGLARISQYNVRARTTSLPITRISRASADQRKGRCGRVGPGICIRIYSEEDYLAREQYTLPEIKRSNLADVILQMTSMNLGSPLDFPFVEPPHPGAIRDGYQLLKELGALSDENRLSQIGRIMARLPIDPPISRILIAARENNCVREIKIIAPALAIQDPRVRPAEREKEADAAHQKFAHPQSDFLSLLNIWELFHQTREKGLSWGRLKKFCKGHYLSFQRMREWIDLHDQLDRLLKREKGFSVNTDPASYDAIHKSLCYGFLRNIGMKKEGEKKLYQGAGGKEFMVFPGSHQFHKSGKWIISAAFLETNRLYALTVANIDEKWLMESADHLCRRSWSNPHFSRKSGQVVAEEKVTLFGLVLSSDRLVNFGRTSAKNREEARDIFIQQALIENQLQGKYPFLRQNVALLQKWQETEERLRKRDLLVDETTLSLFYDTHLPAGVYDRFTLNRFLKKKRDHSFLIMKEEDVLNRSPEERELQDFPRQLRIGSRQLRLQYNLAPGEEDDGVTVRIPLEDMESFSESQFEWLVPGLLREKVTFLLKGLPKRIRKHLIPLNNTVDMLLDDCSRQEGSLYHGLERSILKIFRLQIQRSDWPEPLPPHLRMRYLLYDADGREIATGRELHKLTEKLSRAPRRKSGPGKKTLEKMANWQDRLYSDWDFEGLERCIPVYTKSREVAGYLFATLHIARDRGGVTLSFEGERARAQALNRRGVLFLYQRHFKEAYKGLKKYCHTALSGPSSLWLSSLLGGRKEASEALLHFIMRSLFPEDLDNIPEKETFSRAVERVRQEGFHRRGQEICDQILLLLRKRREVAEHISRFGELARQSNSYDPKRYGEYERLLTEILPPDFLENKGLEELTNCPRYFQGLMIRIERAHANPTKDLNKARQLESTLQRLAALPRDLSSLPPECRQEIRCYREMVEEFRLAIFSPEVKGGKPVSAKKLRDQWQKVQSLCPGI